MQQWPTISSFPYLYKIHLSWHLSTSTFLVPLNVVLMEVCTQTEGAPGVCCLSEYRKMIQSPPKLTEPVHYYKQEVWKKGVCVGKISTDLRGENCGGFIFSLVFFCCLFVCFGVGVVFEVFWFFFFKWEVQHFITNLSKCPWITKSQKSKEGKVKSIPPTSQADHSQTCVIYHEQ